jgi:hypothetical protein
MSNMLGIWFLILASFDYQTSTDTFCTPLKTKRGAPRTRSTMLCLMLLLQLYIASSRWHHHPVTTRFSVCAEALAGARPSTASLGCGGRSDCNSWRGPLPRRHCLALGRCLMLLALACGDNTFTLELGPQLIQHVEAYPYTTPPTCSLRKLLNVGLNAAVN